MRLLNLSAVCFAITSALMLYGLNYETRRVEADVQAMERTAQKTRSDIAVLKAERSHLARPERIDPLARHLGLQPPKPEQFMSAGALATLSDDAHALAQRLPAKPGVASNAR